MISFWRKYGPPIEFLGIVLLVIANTSYMKHAVVFRGVAVVFWLVCLVFYIVTEKSYRTIRFWFFLVLGLLLAINQTIQLIGYIN